jgi:hypothetical protein
MKFFDNIAMPLLLPLSTVICLFYSFLIVPEGYADRIILKDGTIVVSERVWQTEDHVHFILIGTDDVEIRYAKEIVVKIEQQGIAVKPDVVRKPHKTPSASKRIPANPVRPTTGTGTSAEIVSKSPLPSQSMAGSDEAIVKTNRGLSFYDPHREKRYWASRNSTFDTLNDALKALADIYNQSPQWVADNMGEENNLATIHANLIQRQKAELAAAGLKKVPAKPSQHLFYVKGRDYPYHVGPGKDFKTQAEAIDALALQYHQSADWVRQKIGNQNELEKIHQRLSQTAAPTADKAQTSINQAGSRQSSPSLPDGLLFYNPRRDQKYWTGKMSRHNTLQEAMHALAKQYGVTTEWIETHMGNTNDLSAIHRNIKDSLIK